MEKYEPQYLHKWKYPDSYFGDTYEEFYIFMSITRDSDILEESNWKSFLRDYPEGFDEETNKGILITRASHWAVGWVDTIYIHESDYELLKICDKIREDLDNYPIYDEEDYSTRECDAQEESVRDEIKYQWLNKQYEDIDEKIIDDMVYLFCRNSNSNEQIPRNFDEIQELYEDVIHTKECKICKELGRNYEYDDRHGFCDCQLKLFE